jgi:hypothetical protein
MPVARVRMADGRVARINVPEGTTPEQAVAIANRVAPKREKPTSHIQGFLEGLAPAATNAMRALEYTNPFGVAARALSNITGTNSRLLPSQMANQADRQVAQLKARSPYRGSTAGRIAGQVAGTLPTMALPGGPALQGASAAVLGAEDRRPMALAKQALFGAVGGKVGDKVVRGVSQAVSPTVAPVLQRLQQRGIPLTLGQIAGASGGTIGRTIRGIENKLTSAPGAGDAIIDAQQRGFRAFNRAAFNEALAPIAARSPQIAEEGVETSRQAVRNAYTQALDGVRVRPDQEFGDALREAGERGLLSGNYADDFRRIMDTELRPVLAETPGELSGQNVQDALRMTKGYARQYGKLGTEGSQGIPQPAAKPVGQAFDDISLGLESLVNRQAPDVMPAYNAAGEAYRNVGVVRDAVNAAKVGGGGMFTPAQLSQAARANAKKFGGTHGTTDQPFFELTRDAQDVLPSTIPDSGSGGRGAVGLILGGFGGAPALAASAAAAVPYSKPGQKAVEALLTGRQGVRWKEVAKALENLRPFATIGGSIGAPLLFEP